MSIYDDLEATGVEIDNHESDLYVPVTDETSRIVRASGLFFETFRSRIDGKQWYDIPFAYRPWWERRSSHAE